MGSRPDDAHLDRAALIELVSALWRELAAERDDKGCGPATACFDQGRSEGPVRTALVSCASRVLLDDIMAATGEDVARRVPCLEDDIRFAWRARG